MRSAAECREHAKEWHTLAMGFGGDRKQQGMDVAEHWEHFEVDKANSRNLSGAVRAAYDELPHAPMPQVFVDLLGRLEAEDSRREHVRPRTI